MNQQSSRVAIDTKDSKNEISFAKIYCNRDFHRLDRIVHAHADNNNAIIDPICVRKNPSKKNLPVFYM